VLVSPRCHRLQLTGEGGRNHGRGFRSQQWLGLLRIVGRA
jgi:hypothetical protein